MSMDNFRIGAGDLEIDGTSVGHTTEEGVVISYEPDVHFHLTGKYGTTPARASLVGITLTLEVWMAEHTFANIESAFGGVLNDGQIKFGGLAGREMTPMTLALLPYDDSPAWYFRKAVPTGAVETAFKVNDERIIHVTFQALVDENAADDDNLGYVMS
jgi:hypothetical protein